MRTLSTVMMINSVLEMAGPTNLTKKIMGAAIFVGLLATPVLGQVEYSYNTASQASFDEAPTFQPTVISTNAIIPGGAGNASVVWADGGQTWNSSPTTGLPVSNFSAANVSSSVGSSGLAQQKASSAARMSLRGHFGGGLGGARFEGVGWSNQSAQSAIQKCCYWGQRPVAQIGVSRGSDGCWYACVLYQ